MKNGNRNFLSALSGGIIGILGGLMGLGGAEFRLPVLVELFKFTTLHAIIINLVVSLVTVFFSLIFRSTSIPLAVLANSYHVVVNLLAGSLIGAFTGAKLATNITARKLDRIVSAFLVLLGIFMIAHSQLHFRHLDIPVMIRTGAGIAAGLLIGIVSSMLGVAGGELLIPTIILLYAADIKRAGSLSLCVSFPTIIIGLIKYSKNDQFSLLNRNVPFIIYMAIGSAMGAFVGSRILIGISSHALQMILGAILILSGTRFAMRQA